MSTAAVDLPRTFGPYELVRRLASGSMVDVYLAQARSVAGFQKAVAIKMIRGAQSDEDPDFVQQLVEEANIASRLSHKNVVQVIDLGEIEGQHYIAMEYVDGVDLGRLMGRLGPKRGACSPRVAAYVMREVCEGLDHAHRMTDPSGRPLRIVHRDVSPPNILVSFAGEVKLTDFGLAKASLRVSSTQAGQIKGKYSYMAPEQAKGHAVDARSDVFAAGLVLYELLTGRQAYPDAPLPLMLERITRAIFEPAERVRPDLPPSLADVVRRALAADASQRYPSARALADDLTAFLYTQDPQPEGELAQLLERVSNSARSHLAPLGAPLVDDDSDEVTSLEAQRAKPVATTLTPAVAPRSRPQGPPQNRSAPPAPPAAPNVARVRHAPPPPALKPTQTPPPMPAVQDIARRADPARMSDPTPGVLRAPSLPGPARPAKPPAADDHPTEVMDAAGPDAELLATAAAMAPPPSPRPPPPPVAAPVPAAPPAPPAAPLVPAVAAPAPAPPPAATAPRVGFDAPAADSLRPRARAPLAPPPGPLSPDVTAPVPRVRVAKPSGQTPLVIAAAVGVLVGLLGAVALLVFRS